MKLVRMLEHFDEDFLGRVLRRLTVSQETKGEVVDTRAITVVDLRGWREVACLNDSHQLLIAQVLHSRRSRWSDVGIQEKVTELDRLAGGMTGSPSPVTCQISDTC